MNMAFERRIAGFWDGQSAGQRNRPTFRNIDPATGSVVALVEEATRDDVDAAVRAAKAALKGPWGTLSIDDRAKVLHKIADEIEKRFDEFLRAEILDTGKPISMASHLDIPRGAAVVRPLHSGWRYFPSRDAGIIEFFGVAFASTDVTADVRLWTSIFNGKVTDYVGDAVYISIDEEHHRIAVHPSVSDRLLEVQFRLEGMHELMQNSYFLQSAQVVIAHGPGRRPIRDPIRSCLALLPTATNCRQMNIACRGSSLAIRALSALGAV